MDTLVIRGGRPLQGTVTIDGAKNAILPILAACLLSDKEIVIGAVPELHDVYTITEVLTALGVRLRADLPDSVTVQADDIERLDPPAHLVRRMRASFLVMGPLLARFGRALIPLPGGCAIGSRPIDLHLKGFEAMGASVSIAKGRIEARVNGRLHGNRIYLDIPSVGATENIMMAAVLAEGVTIIEEAAEEPEVVDLANFLGSLGARISGAGTKVIRIEGVDELGGTRYTAIPDRIEAGTFMVATAISQGDVVVDNVIIDHLKPIVAKLREMGVEVTEDSTSVRVTSHGRPYPTDVKTLPYPGFPTDMQAQFMALTSLGSGTSVVTETVFENRFMHVPELCRMGAHISVEGRSAIVRGVPVLSGAPVFATDLRAGAALVLAGLAATGETEISGVHHIDRGYVHLERKLATLGADIKRRAAVSEGVAE